MFVCCNGFPSKWYKFNWKPSQNDCGWPHNIFKIILVLKQSSKTTFGPQNWNYMFWTSSCWLFCLKLLFGITTVQFQPVEHVPYIPFRPLVKTARCVNSLANTWCVGMSLETLILRLQWKYLDFVEVICAFWKALIPRECTISQHYDFEISMRWSLTQ